MQNYLDKLKMIGWNSLDITCKYEWAIFTRWINSFTGPLTYRKKFSLEISVSENICKN